METIQSDKTFKIIRDWDVQSKRLKEKFSQLTDADLEFETGNESELFTRIETRLNKRRGEVINMIIKESRKEK
jgi:hypothetical protein